MIKLGMSFKLECGNKGKVTEVFSQGFNYHTLDQDGNCIKGEQYILKSAFETKENT